MNNKQLGKTSSVGQIDTFLKQLANTSSAGVAKNGGRLVFALDATASREPTWQAARRLQSAMFKTAADFGSLSIQLCYYQGANGFFASPWLTDARELLATMEKVECLTGLTQISRVMSHAVSETRRQPVSTIVFIGDCVEENTDHLCQLAGQLGVLKSRLFMFQEGRDAATERVFRQLAQLSGGAYSRFDAGSASQLGELLAAVAAYASGGLAALESFGQNRGNLVKQLAHQIASRK